MKEERLNKGDSDQEELKYSLHLRLGKKVKFFGPGVARLMLLVDETHSLNIAAERMGMAYSKAWKILKEAERELGYLLMTRKAGGPGGGGSTLTPEGRDFLERFLAFQEESYAVTDQLFKSYFGDLYKEEAE